MNESKPEKSRRDSFHTLLFWASHNFHRLKFSRWQKSNAQKWIFFRIQIWFYCSKRFRLVICKEWNGFTVPLFYIIFYWYKIMPFKQIHRKSERAFASGDYNLIRLKSQQKKKREIVRFLIRHHWQTKDSKLRTEDWRFHGNKVNNGFCIQKFEIYFFCPDSRFAYSLLTLCHLLCSVLWWRSMLFLLNMKNIILLYFSDAKYYRMKRWWWRILNIASSALLCICNEKLNVEWGMRA